LLALMLLNASRFASRTDKEGNILTLAEQDRSQWNGALIQKGLSWLEKSAAYNRISIYHIIAAISALHCAAPDFASTNWKGILNLYDHLLLIDHSPLVKLNRAVPLARVAGVQQALEELQKLKHDPPFNSYHLLYATEGEFYFELQDYGKAADAFRQAILFASLPAEKQLLQKKLERCLKNIS
jgi:predicted RNA polymerase sigma factor